MDSRTLPTNDFLKTLVAAYLGTICPARLVEFTAWDVTNALRAANPTLEIKHYSPDAQTAGVRMYVQELMLPRLEAMEYDAMFKPFPKGMETVNALVYVPVPMVVTITNDDATPAQDTQTGAQDTQIGIQIPVVANELSA